MSRSVAKNFFKKEEKFQKQAVTMVKFVFCIFYCGTIKKKKSTSFLPFLKPMLTHPCIPQSNLLGLEPHPQPRALPGLLHAGLGTLGSQPGAAASSPQCLNLSSTTDLECLGLPPFCGLCLC